MTTTTDTTRNPNTRAKHGQLAWRSAAAALLLLSLNACHDKPGPQSAATAEADSEHVGEDEDVSRPAAETDSDESPTADNDAAAHPDEAVGDPVFSAERLEQMVAPVALYPDSLVTQVLMASTYPLEIVEAERWVKVNPGVQGEELDKALAAQRWDDSVKALARFPDVLTQMSNNLDWTKDLGDAFLAQKADVLNAVQTMRLNACDAGKLKSTPEQNVVIEPVTEAAPPPERPLVVAQPQRIVRILPVDPVVIHVPIYSPAVVFGPPAELYYPIFNAYPAGYVASSAVISFGIGLTVGAVLWGEPDWYSHRVYMHHYGDGYGGGYRGGYRGYGNYGGYGGYGGGHNNGHYGHGYSGNGRAVWQHDGAHRGGQAYRSPAVTSYYGPGGRGGGSNQRRSGGNDQGRSGGMDRGRDSGLNPGRGHDNHGGDQGRASGGRAPEPGRQGQHGPAGPPAGRGDGNGHGPQGGHDNHGGGGDGPDRHSAGRPGGGPSGSHGGGPSGRPSNGPSGPHGGGPSMGGSHGGGGPSSGHSQQSQHSQPGPGAQAPNHGPRDGGHGGPQGSGSHGSGSSGGRNGGGNNGGGKNGGGRDKGGQNSGSGHGKGGN